LSWLGDTAIVEQVLVVGTGIMHRLVTHFVLLILLLGLPCSVQSSNLRIQVTDEHKQPLADAVVELFASQPMPHQAAALSNIAQENLTFVPFISAIVAGSSIEFPNRDKTRHHVYSFSDAKSFEIQLYANKPEAPILFDKAGIVSIGCNIHDYMQAYVYVGSSPLLGVTNDQGEITFYNLTNDTYQVKLWHPWQKNDHDSLNLVIDRDSDIALTMAVLQKQKPAAPKRGFGH
jgi:plastocyanin